MRRVWRNLAPAMGLMIVLSAIPTMAQEETLTVNIPFSFTIENTTLPAGEYMVLWPMPESRFVMEIRSQKGDHSVFALTEAVTRPSNQQAKSELVFDKIGNKEFLSQVWLVDNPTGYDVPRSKFEKLAEHNSAQKAQRHSVAAHHKTHKNMS